MMIAFIVVAACFILVIWYDIFRKLRSKLHICVKCKYAVRQHWWGRFRLEPSCRTPKDIQNERSNFVTGKTRKVVYSCNMRNVEGKCPEYRKVWWRQ